MDEAVKYLVINIYDKNKRDHAGRIAIILTARANPRPVRAMVNLLRRKAITTLTVALGPGVDMKQINDITKFNPENRAYVLSSTSELPERLLELTDYLCTLGMEPEGEKPQTTTTTRAPRLEPSPTRHLPNTLASTSPSGPSPISTLPSSIFPTTDVTIILEGSDAVGESNFNQSLLFLREVVSQLTEEKSIRITVIQYSETVTVEIRRWELRQQTSVLLQQRLSEIRWRGGSRTNTGAAVTTAVTTFQETATVQPSRGPTPPQLVFLVTENPPTDTVTRPPFTSTHTQVYPIGVGPKIRETDLRLSSPPWPLMVDEYSSLSTLVHRVVNITRSTIRPRFPTLSPVVVQTPSSLPPSGTHR